MTAKPERYYRACEIFSRSATATKPARRGVLPITATTFYKFLKAGKFPQPDAKVGSVRLWSGRLVRDAMENSLD